MLLAYETGVVTRPYPQQNYYNILYICWQLVEPEGIEPSAHATLQLKATDLQSAEGNRLLKLVPMDNFEMSAFRLSSECSSSELHR